MRCDPMRQAEGSSRVKRAVVGVDRGRAAARYLFGRYRLTCSYRNDKVTYKNWLLSMHLNNIRTFGSAPTCFWSRSHNVMNDLSEMEHIT